MDALVDFLRQDLGNPGLAMLVANPQFAFIQLMNSLSMGMYLFIISAGLSLIFGVLKVINFAHGAFYMFGAYIVYSVTQTFELNFWLGIVGAAIGLAVIAVVVERGLFQFLYDKEHLMQLLLTFAVVLIMGDLAKLIWGTDQYSVSYPAGMEGALPSIVGGWVDCPVIAVPTSVGYGASLGGIAALLGMLNSCASNVTVVNIDAGFKAAYVAGLIARRRRPDGRDAGSE